MKFFNKKQFSSFKADLPIQYGLVNLRTISGTKMVVAGIEADICAIGLYAQPQNEADCLCNLKKQFNRHWQRDLAWEKFWQDQFDTHTYGEYQQFPMVVFGTQFQQQVWHNLCLLEPGEVISYGELAHRMGFDRARYGRAIGSAVGKNPISLIIPCHLIQSGSGQLTGYRWGMDLKKELLGRVS